MSRINLKTTRKSLAFTSSIPEDLYKKLTSFAQKNKMQKNKVLEEALNLFFLEDKKKSFIEGVKKWGQDSENIVWAEMGMKEYSETLKKMDE